MRLRSILALSAMAVLPLPTAAAPVTWVTIDDGEARAVLSILHALQNRTAVAQSDWTALFATTGYRRLKQREADFKRAFTDEDFKAFVTSPELIAKTADLQRTIDAWSTQNLSAMETRARRYLPQGAQLKAATVFPCSRPRAARTCIRIGRIRRTNARFGIPPWLITTAISRISNRSSRVLPMVR